MANMNIFQMLSQLKANPAQMLGNIPQGVNMQDPNAIIQHLMSTGRISQAQYNQAVNQAHQMGFHK